MHKIHTMRTKYTKYLKHSIIVIIFNKQNSIKILFYVYESTSLHKSLVTDKPSHRVLCKTKRLVING